MIDWDRLVVESENNGVIASAGQVSLLVGADAVGVTWGNITGDVEQQADLMALVDGYAPVESPQFTGTPRTVTPPAQNSSTRIASTAYVRGEIVHDINELVSAKEAPMDSKLYGRKNQAWDELGTLAKKNDANSDNAVYARKNGTWVELGEMAMHDEPSPNGSSHKKTWIRTNELDDQGREHPQWEILDNFGSTSVGKYYARTMEVDEQDETRIYPAWHQLGTLSIVDEPPMSERPESNPDLYARASYSYEDEHGNTHYARKWVRIG